uniref:Uncharacterized protein n=1 Tax=Acrobeloides nanus TaxID=290746 RepID=A0A914D781_9BILA
MTYRYVLLMAVIYWEFIIIVTLRIAHGRYDSNTNGQFIQDYEVFDESFFYVHFETGNLTEIKNGSLADYYWVMTVDVDYKTCDCGTPSTSYFYDPIQDTTIYTMSNLIEDRYNYCAPMKCTWKASYSSR